MKIKNGKWYLTTSNHFVKAICYSKNSVIYKSSIDFIPETKSFGICSFWETDYIVKRLKKKDLNPYLEYFV